MPIDDFGIRADVIVHAGSPFSRMNISQLYEQGINRVSEFVRRKLEYVYKTEGILNAYELLLDYYNDINPNYATLVRNVHGNDITKQTQHVLNSIRDKIYLNIPPFLKTMYDDDAFKRMLSKLEKDDPEHAKKIREEHNFTEELLPPEQYKENIMAYLEKKWGVKTSPVTYTIKDKYGERVCRTETNVCIGAKYMYILYKLPNPSASGLSKVSHYGMPIKTKDTQSRLNHIYSMNPTRFGEDEFRISHINASSETNTRLMALQSSSPYGVELGIETLLNAEHPTAIESVPISNKELRDTNSIIGLAEHILATVGIEIANTDDTKIVSDIVFDNTSDDEDDNSNIFKEDILNDTDEEDEDEVDIDDPIID